MDTPTTEATVPKLVALYREGNTLAEIESVTGISRYKLRRLLTQAGVKMRKAQPRGYKTPTPQQKHRQKQVARDMARDLYQQGHARHDIAEALNKNKSTIWKWTQDM